MKLTRDVVDKVLKAPVVINIATEIDLYMVHKKLELILDVSNHSINYIVRDLIKQKTNIFDDGSLDIAIDKYNEIGG